MTSDYYYEYSASTPGIFSMPYYICHNHKSTFNFIKENNIFPSFYKRSVWKSIYIFIEYISSLSINEIILFVDREDNNLISTCYFFKSDLTKCFCFSFHESFMNFFSKEIKEVIQNQLILQ